MAGGFCRAFETKVKLEEHLGKKEGHRTCANEIFATARVIEEKQKR